MGINAIMKNQNKRPSYTRMRSSCGQHICRPDCRPAGHGPALPMVHQSLVTRLISARLVVPAAALTNAD